MIMALTSIQTSPALVLENIVEAGEHVLLGTVLASHVSAALDGQIGVCDRGGNEFANGTEIERVGRSDLSSCLEHVLQLLKDCVLKDRVDDQYQRRHDAGK